MDQHPEYADLSLRIAERVLKAGVEAACNSGAAVNIAIVDRGANLKLFVRMDGAWLGSVDIAIRKARTARLFDRNSGDLGRISQPGGPIYGIEHSNGGLITFPGGVPLRISSGEIIGAVGVSGSTIDVDQAIAEAAANSVTVLI